MEGISSDGGGGGGKNTAEVELKADSPPLLLVQSWFVPM